jgi:hypothetical protein
MRNQNIAVTTILAFGLVACTQQQSDGTILKSLSGNPEYSVKFVTADLRANQIHH